MDQFVDKLRHSSLATVHAIVALNHESSPKLEDFFDRVAHYKKLDEKTFDHKKNLVLLDVETCLQVLIPELSDAEREILNKYFVEVAKVK